MHIYLTKMLILTAENNWRQSRLAKIKNIKILICPVYLFYLIYQLFYQYLEMQKSPYFPSPLRKDYTTKPLRNFVPILPTQLEILPNKNQSNSKNNKKQKQNNLQKPQNQQKQKRYLDGLLVTIIKNSNKQSGLFLMNNHACMIYNLEQQAPQGKNYIFYPSGVIMSLYYQNGVLCWIVSYSQQKFIGCYHYRKGFRQGQQYFYDYNDKMLIISQYRRGNLKEIKNGQIGQFEKIVKNQQIIKRVSQLRNKNLQLPKNFPKIITQALSYFGQIDEKSTNPHGYGILLTNKELFMGKFSRGFLNGLGCIKFKNNDYYYGHFINGVFEGYGSITDSKKTTYKFGQIPIQKQQFDAYISQETPPQIEQNWLRRYGSIDKFHQQFKNKYQFINQNNNEEQQEQNQQQQQQQQQNQDPSQFHLQIESQKQDDLNYSSSNYASNWKLGNSSAKKDQNENRLKNSIPKLSLFKKLDDKSRNKALDSLDGAVRKRKRQEQQQNNRTQTQRNNRDVIKKITLKVPKQQKKPQKIKYKNNQYYQTAQYEQQEGDMNNAYTISRKNRQNPQRNSPRQQHRVQNVGLDRWHVSSQTNFTKPYQSDFAVKFNKGYKNPHNSQWNKYILQKKQNSVNINRGKIFKASSDVSDTNQQQFLDQILTHQQFQQY